MGVERGIKSDAFWGLRMSWDNRVNRFVQSIQQICILKSIDPYNIFFCHDYYTTQCAGSTMMLTSLQWVKEHRVTMWRCKWSECFSQLVLRRGAMPCVCVAKIRQLERILSLWVEP